MVIPTLTQSFETTLIQIFPKIIWCLCVLLPLLTITSKPHLIQVHQIRHCSVKLIPISAWSCPGSLHPPTKPPQNFCCVYLWNLPFYLFFQPTHTPPFTQWSWIKNSILLFMKYRVIYVHELYKINSNFVRKAQNSSYIGILRS